MTRINVVPVGELCDQHLLAEHRELTRIPNGIISGKLKTHYPDRPKDYTLGAGHVKFFTDKLWYLVTRYGQLQTECERRGFNVIYKWPTLNHGLWNATGGHYIPTENALAINRARIQDRMPKNARWTIYAGVVKFGIHSGLKLRRR